MNKKKQILVVEDNEINQEIISSILENDFNVLKANDGLEALKIIKDKRNSISLIMTDVNMPNIYKIINEDFKELYILWKIRSDNSFRIKEFYLKEFYWQGEKN